MGFAGFLYVVARAIVAGVDRVRRQPAGVDLVVSILAVLFVVMFTVYTYVDIAWEPRNAVLLGLFLALCCSPAAEPVVVFRRVPGRAARGSQRGLIPMRRLATVVREELFPPHAVYRRLLVQPLAALLPQGMFPPTAHGAVPARRNPHRAGGR